jgi:hypothetical protein
LPKTIMPPVSSDSAPLRLAELMAALSIAADFGMGQPLEFALPILRRTPSAPPPPLQAR